MDQPNVARGIGFIVGEGRDETAARARVELPALVCRVLPEAAGTSGQRDALDSARDLALAAYLEGRDQGAGFGLGLCATPGYACVGVQSAQATITFETSSLGDSAFDLLRTACEAPARERPGWVRRETQAPAEWSQLLRGEVQAVAHAAGNRRSTRVVFPGSFHPFHEGHARLARVAHEITGHAIDFEVCIANVDKPPLHFQAMAERIASIDDWRAPHHNATWLTRAATFVAKARLFDRGTTFVVGIDTLQRIGDPRYHAGPEALREALRELRDEHACAFLAFPRADQDGRVVGADAVRRLPQALQAMTRLVDVASVRDVLEVSSSAIRGHRTNGGRQPLPQGPPT